MEFRWKDDIDASTGQLYLGGHRTAAVLRAVRALGRGWLAEVGRWPWPETEAVAGAFPKREQAKAAAERNARGLPTYLALLMRDGPPTAEAGGPRRDVA